MNRWAVDSGFKAESEAPVEADESGAERDRLRDGALELAYILESIPCRGDLKRSLKSLSSCEDRAAISPACGGTEKIAGDQKQCSRNKSWKRRPSRAGRFDCAAGSARPGLRCGSPRLPALRCCTPGICARISPMARPGYQTGPNIPTKVGMEMRPSAGTCLATGMWRATSTRRLRFRCGRFWSGCCSS